MNIVSRASGRAVWVAIRAMAVLTVLLGVGYPLAITGIGQLAFPSQANGSGRYGPDGRLVGSALLGQAFADAEGNPLPEYFQPRPSAAGGGYDAAASSGSNHGPENEELIAAIQRRRAQVAAFNGVPGDAVPADAVTASGSGLDPHISPAYARLQVDRVAAARHLRAEDVRALVESRIQPRDLGYLGEPRVNVVELNLALDDLDRRS
ncbi:potassium-transporting ATPase subunit KdpC [Rhizomonospora bruguierae]|uniref:potassium-transporting ATPase subunit KdpC n=1 Tax=Rhizomonospora bruguierae TaxID=1581705 RepID=UPI001BD0363D|nr:potassium-transporting ATPase subunit KdpC [Micromonospora sp. NBRC 107566]